MSDQRLRAVGDLEQAWKELVQQFEKSQTETKTLISLQNILLDTLKKLIDESEEYKKVLDSIVEPKTMRQLREQQQLFNDIAESVKKTTKVKQNLSDVEKEREKAIKKETQLREKLESTLKGERDEIIKLQEENRRATKAKRDEVKATMDLDDAYKTLVNDTNKARNEFKRLAVQHGVNSKEAQEAKVKFELLDGELREVNDAAKDGTRDVGRYSDAIRGARDTTLKWTAAITGAAASLYGLFTSANEQDQLNKRLTSSFDLTGDALDRNAKKVEFLSRAYDTETNEVIETATALTNEFGIESERAFGLIEEGFTKGANVRGEFLEQLKEYSTQFVNVGLSAEEAIAVITQQENKGVFSDKGVDAIKEAGLRLTEMPKATDEALKAIGLSGTEIQKQIESGQKTVFEVTQEISREIAKLPPNATEVGTVLADVFGGAGEDAKGFVLELGNLSTELGDLEDKTTDFERAQQKLTEKFVEIKQNISNALIPAFTFLAENFQTIVKIGGTLLQFFIAYQVQVNASRILNSKFVTGLKDMGSRIKEVVKGGKSLKDSFKGIGESLKNIGWAAAITGAFKLAQAFWDVSSGARQARQDAQLLDATVGKFNQKISEGLEIRKKELDQQLELAKTEEERKKLREDFITQNEKEAAGLQKVLDKNKAALEIAKKYQKEQSGLSEMQAEFADQFGEFFGQDLRDINDIVGEYEAKVAAAEGGLKTLNVSTMDAKHSLEVYNKELQDNLDNLRDGNAEMKERESLLREIEDAENDLIKNELERQKQRLDIDLTRSIEEIEQSTAIEEEKARLKTLVIEQYIRDINKLQDEANQKQLDDAKSLIEGFQVPSPEPPEAEDFGLGIEEEYTQRRLKLLLDAKKSDEEIAEELSEYRIDLLEREIARRDELGLESTEFQIELAELERRRREEEMQKWLAAGKEALNNLGQAASKYTDDRIKEQDRLIASEQELLETLKNSAEQGTLEQGQSIARQEQAIRNAQEEKIRLEKQKQAVEFATAAITTFTSALEQGKSVPEAFADVALSQAGLELVLNQLPKFFHGAEDTGNVGLFHDQYGPVTGVTHQGEAVFTKEENDRKKKAGFTNESMLDAAIRMKELDDISKNYHSIDSDAYMQMLFMPQVATPVYDDDRMLRKLDSIAEETRANTKAIQNIKFPQSKLGEIWAGGMTILDDDGKGNTLETLIRNRNKA